MLFASGAAGVDRADCAATLEKTPTDKAALNTSLPNDSPILPDDE
ncbi:hypothetical protein [Noviherbaspirillum humi]|nr:hypothetical protein [Noviherbaspirillum humi]